MQSQDRFVLIQDGACPYCSASADAAVRVDDIGVVGWQAKEAQKFLEVQFGEIPRVMTLINMSEKKVYTGKEAMSELCKLAGVPKKAAEQASREFAKVATDTVNHSSNGTHTDEYHTVSRLNESAKILGNALLHLSEEPLFVTPRA